LKKKVTFSGGGRSSYSLKGGKNTKGGKKTEERKKRRKGGSQARKVVQREITRTKTGNRRKTVPKKIIRGKTGKGRGDVCATHKTGRIALTKKRERSPASGGPLSQNQRKEREKTDKGANQSKGKIRTPHGVSKKQKRKGTV